MDLETHFKKQLDEGVTDKFLYGLEKHEENAITLQYHKGTLDTFPKNLEFVRLAVTGVPMFKEATQS